MFVKDALEEEVGIMVELRGAIWRNFQPKKWEIVVIVNEPEKNTWLNTTIVWR